MPTQTITYGTATFPFAKLTVAQETVYSPNRVDVVGTAFTFAISGWLTSDTFNGLNALVSLLRGNLATPRQPFSVQWNEGSDTAILYNFTKTDDIEWGPKPSNVNIGPFLGGRAALYSCQIRVVVKECFTCDSSSCTPNTRPSEVLSISRKFDHAIDKNGQTVRTVTGELIVTSKNQPGDYYRALCDVPLPMWFQRQSMNFNESEDGLRLSYSIVDRELGFTLPKPITSGNAFYTVRTSSGMSIGKNAGAMRQQYTLAGEFTAPVNVLPSDIIQQIMQLALDRFPFNTGIGLLQTEREYSEDIFETNTIRFSMSCESAAGNGFSPFDPQTGVATFGLKPTNTTGQSALIGVYGGDGISITSGVIAPKPIIYDACTPPTSSSPTSPTQIPTTPGTQYQVTNQGSPDASAAFQNQIVSQAHLDSPYFEVNERIIWEVDNGYDSFYPKVAGTDPVFQRVRQPRAMIYQAGYVTRDVFNASAIPSAAAPIYDSSQAKMLQSIIDSEIPVPIGTGGWERFTIHWGYAMEWAKTLLPKANNSDPNQNQTPGLDSLKIGFEKDPRVIDSSGERLIPTTVPNGLLDTTVPKPQTPQTP